MASVRRQRRRTYLLEALEQLCEWCRVRQALAGGKGLATVSLLHTDVDEPLEGLLVSAISQEVVGSGKVLDLQVGGVEVGHRSHKLV